ncbi:MAG: hypothetical protein AW08_02789 [Candidatus Accumulibacter adjunctus]|uniref:DUF4124 domain-containing protein n=1 Tax=Candidatus Accumulibacter adjunctus TaxID=1454001 RepID=A0A011NNQ2_9PROT|nr:MAG: hypothetical protein AW08_02789 [Candidatus Accumulibacter adjunctus]
MNWRGLIVVVLGLQICQPASAGAMFKCEVNGRVEFSDRRCQPVKPAYAERDSKDAQRSPSAASAVEAGRPPVHPATVEARTGNTLVLPGRLAFNDSGHGAESRLRGFDSRHEPQAYPR